jgi:hypothetical protein
MVFSIRMLRRKFQQTLLSFNLFRPTEYIRIWESKQFPIASVVKTILGSALYCSELHCTSINCSELHRTKLNYIELLCNNANLGWN